jgi:RHS repeat-associated protein
MRDESGLKYFLTDHLGSIVAVTDESGEVISEQRYLPFGQVREDVGNITQTDFSYTGQRANSYIKLLDYDFRWYDPYLNHFTQPDIIVPDPYNSQSYDRYSYALNNPIRYADPSGHMAWEGEGGNCPKELAAYYEKRNNELKCRAGNDIYCSGYENSKDDLANVLTHVTIAADTTATIISLGEAGIADFAIGATLVLSAVQPEAAALIPEALLLDFYLASPFNPFGFIEDGLGFVSLSSTFATDWLSENTHISSDGLYIGKDTIVAGRNTLLGNYPESNFDLAVNVSQLSYDMDRLNGARPGGSINVLDVNTLLGQIFWYDSPFQDIFNLFR